MIHFVLTLSLITVTEIFEKSWLKYHVLNRYSANSKANCHDRLDVYNHHDESMKVQATVVGFPVIRLVVQILSNRNAFLVPLTDELTRVCLVFFPKAESHVRGSGCHFTSDGNGGTNWKLKRSSVYSTSLLHLSIPNKGTSWCSFV